MSDLHRAVEDEINAFRPDRIPPFAAVLARHRARSRRRYATGAAALSAVAVAGIVFVPSALSGGSDRLPSYANPDPTQAQTTDFAARLCADAATDYNGEVAAAYDTTVQAVRGYMIDPHGNGGDLSVGPIPGPYTYPAGWAEKAPNDSAAACYIDADFPTPRPPGAPAADRALIMVTESATAFLATAGPKENLPTAPLTAVQTVPLTAADYLGVWTGPDGMPAEAGESQQRTFELATRRMPDHCDWEKAVILQVPWPLGTTYAIGPPEVPLREYTRDADGVLPNLPNAFRGELDLDATLPEGSRPTGYELGEVELWFGPDGGEDYAYLVSPGRVEQWPIAVEPILCA